MISIHCVQEGRKRITYEKEELQIRNICFRIDQLIKVVFEDVVCLIAFVMVVSMELASRMDVVDLITVQVVST